MSEIGDKFLLTLDGRVDALGERIARVEGTLSAPPKKLITEYGGYIALVISILVGGWTLYDIFILQPIKETAQTESNFRNNVNNLANLGARVARAFSESPLAGNAELTSAAPQRLALMAEIEKADQAMPHVLKFADRLLLASEYEVFSKLPEALKQIDLAYAVATDEYQRANSDWRRARLIGAMGYPEEMRDAYQRALDEFKSLGLQKTAADVLRLYGSWVGQEISYDQCDQARDVYARMVQDFKSSQVIPMTRVMIRDEFEQLLQQLPQACQLDAGELDAG